MMGNLRVVASADLGGLGPSKGIETEYFWGPWLLALPCLPFVVLAALLALKPNRCRQAWWIWAPVAVVVGLQLGAELLLKLWSASLIPTEITSMVAEALVCGSLGLAAAWLLSPFLGVKSRIASAVGVLGSALAVGLPALYLRLESGLGTEPFIPMALYMVLNLAALSVALSVAGRACRWRFGGLIFSARLLAWVVVVWLLISLPFVFGVALSSGADSPLGMVVPALICAGLCFLIVLPFVALSLAHPFWRQRLLALLRLTGESQPPAPSSA